MLPHTQKTLDQLTWNEIQKLHSSLGLKVTAGTRTRRDYQRRIVESQPQPIAEPEAVATALTCATCPLARYIDGDRYCCPLTDSVVRGHWEAKTDDCYDAVVAQSEATEIVAEVEAPITPQEIVATTTDDTPLSWGDSGRYIETATIASSLIDDNFMTAFTKESPEERKFNDLAHLEQLEMNAQIALERTYIGSDDEKFALLFLQKVECDIAHHKRPQLEPQTFSVIAQLEIQMTELKSEVQKQFTIDPSILITKPKLAPVSLEPEGTIHWHGSLQGTITGKKGALRNFYIKSKDCFSDINLSDPATYEIMIVLGDFTVAEFNHPNIRHRQIRSAINAGRLFDPRNFKDSEEFLIKTKDYSGIGRIMQHAGDGRWWAWLNNGVTGQPFSHENLAQRYLDHVADRRRSQAQKVEAHAN